MANIEDNHVLEEDEIGFFSEDADLPLTADVRSGDIAEDQELEDRRNRILYGGSGDAEERNSNDDGRQFS